jgi:hypothetical protein
MVVVLQKEKSLDMLTDIHRETCAICGEDWCFALSNSGQVKLIFVN